MPSREDGKLQLCLIVEMLVDPHGVDTQLIKEQILGVVQQAATGGVLTGTSDAELVDHKAHVSPYTKNYQDIPSKKAVEIKAGGATT